MQHGVLLVLMGAALCGCGGMVASDPDPSGSGGGAGSGGSSGAGGGGSQRSMARDIGIAEVSINQGVEIALSAEGPSTTLPILAGRAALVRVLLQTEPGFVPREIVAELDLAGAPSTQLTELVHGSSTKSDVQSGFSFRLEGDAITPSSTLSITLLEADSRAGAGAEAGARFPAAGSIALGARPESAALRVVIVPVVANGFAPDTSGANLALLENRLRAMYPVSATSFSLRAPIAFDGPISADGTGFEQLLSELVALRIGDGAGYGVYYYGLLAPAASASDYCSGGCVGGLSFKPGVLDDAWRCSVGVGHFPDGSHLDAPEVMAHELGHAHGLSHAPCGTPDAPPFPHPDGQIGVWGWDSVSGQSMPPAAYHDVMSYCGPSWISDVNYARIWQRTQAVSGAPSLVSPGDPGRAAGRFRSAVLDRHGGLSWGPTLELARPVFGGETRRITLRDAMGQNIGAVDGVLYGLDHAPGGMLIVRESLLKPLPAVRGIQPSGTRATLSL